MSTELAPVEQISPALRRVGLEQLPAIVTNEGEQTTKRFLEFFTAIIWNKNTRLAYARAFYQFMAWCEDHHLTLHDIEALHVATYIEKLTQEREPQTVKQHLAALCMLFDWLVTGQCMPSNPASSVRGPRYSYKKGKTPILDKDGVKKLFESIDSSTVIGLRDRALIAMMYYTFGRVSAVVALDVRDYYPRGKRHFIGLWEKGGKDHEVPLHHKAQEYLDAYIEASGLAGQKDKPLFRTTGGRGRSLSEDRMDRKDTWKMIKRRALRAGILEDISPHSFCGTGITLYLESGGSLEHAQAIADHASPRPTKLYDRTGDQLSLDEIERIPSL